MAKKPVKKKKNDPDKKARVHKELEGFEIKVNPLGEITSTYTIEEVNQFLNRHVRDKKIVHREGQFGEDAQAKSAAEAARLEAEEFDAVEGRDDELEETDEDFMQRTSREAKRKKAAGSDEDEAAEIRRELPE